MVNKNWFSDAFLTFISTDNIVYEICDYFTNLFVFHSVWEKAPLAHPWIRVIHKAVPPGITPTAPGKRCISWTTTMAEVSRLWHHLNGTIAGGPTVYWERPLLRTVALLQGSTAPHEAASEKRAHFHSHIQSRSVCGCRHADVFMGKHWLTR